MSSPEEEFFADFSVNGEEASEEAINEMERKASLWLSAVSPDSYSQYEIGLTPEHKLIFRTTLYEENLEAGVSSSILITDQDDEECIGFWLNWLPSGEFEDGDLVLDMKLGDLVQAIDELLTSSELSTYEETVVSYLQDLLDRLASQNQSQAKTIHEYAKELGRSMSEPIKSVVATRPSTYTRHRAIDYSIDDNRIISVWSKTPLTELSPEDGEEFQVLGITYVDALEEENHDYVLCYKLYYDGSATLTCQKFSDDEYGEDIEQSPDAEGDEHDYHPSATYEEKLEDRLEALWYLLKNDRPGKVDVAILDDQLQQVLEAERANLYRAN